MPVEKKRTKVRHKRKSTTPNKTLMASLACTAGMSIVVGAGLLVWYVVDISFVDGLTNDHTKGFLGIGFAILGASLIVVRKIITATFKRRHRRGV